MSRAGGQVFTQEGLLIGFFLYCGTSSVALPRISNSSDESWELWIKGNLTPTECTCGSPPSNVTLFADYGRGFHWEADVCLKCGVILAEYTDPYPRPSQPIMGYNNEDATDERGWPMDGHPFGAKKAQRVVDPAPALA